jgi:hypothetical protein
MARTLTAVAMVAVPALAAAQNASTTAQANPSAEHLAAARAALTKVLNSPAPNADAVRKLSEIKTEYIALEKAASTASPEWSAHYQTIDRLSAELMGSPQASGVSGAVGTSGTTGVAMNADMSANLESFRKELSAFAAAMATVAPGAAAAKTTAAPAATASAATPPAAAPTTAPTTSAAAAPPTAPTTSAAAAATTAPTASATAPATPDASVLAKLDAVTTMIDAALKANSPDNTATGPVSIDRAMLENMKAQLEQAKQALRRQ